MQKIVVIIAVLFILVVYIGHTSGKSRLNESDFTFIKYAWASIAIAASGLILVFHKWKDHKSVFPSKKLLKKNMALKTEIANRKLEIEQEKLKAELKQLRELEV
jgi:hypothetical protein